MTKTVTLVDKESLVEERKKIPLGSNYRLFFMYHPKIPFKYKVQQELSSEEVSILISQFLQKAKAKVLSHLQQQHLVALGNHGEVHGCASPFFVGHTIPTLVNCLVNVTGRKGGL